MAPMAVLDLRLFFGSGILGSSMTPRSIVCAVGLRMVPCHFILELRSAASLEAGVVKSWNSGLTGFMVAIVAIADAECPSCKYLSPI